MTTAITFDDTQFTRALAAWEDRVQEAARKALRAAGDEVAKETAASFDNGDGPKSRSGALAGSVRATEPVKGFAGWEMRVGPAGLEYVRRVELGKRGAHSAPPHPYFQPGFRRAGEKFVEIFTTAMAEVSPGR